MSREFKIYDPEGLGNPLGLYSHVAQVGDFAFIAGQVGVDRSGTVVGEDLETQFRQTLVNLQEALRSAKSDLDHVVKLTTYLVDADHIDPFMMARRKLFPEFFTTTTYPPNTLLVVQGLVKADLKIEIEAIAYRRA